MLLLVVGCGKWDSDEKLTFGSGEDLTFICVWHPMYWDGENLVIDEIKVIDGCCELSKWNYQPHNVTELEEIKEKCEYIELPLDDEKLIYD